MEQAVHDRRALGVGGQFALIADQAAGRAMEHEAQAVAAGGAHFQHLGLALRHFLHDDARVFIVHVDDDFLDGFEDRAVLLLLEHHARARNAQLETLAAHGLDENAKLQFAATGNDIGVGIRRRLDLERDIALGLAEQAVSDDAAGDLVALGAGQRRIVDREGHRQGRGVDRLGLQGLGHIQRAERVGDVELLKARDGDDVACFRLVDRLALDAAEGENLGDATLLDHLARAVEHLDRAVGLDRAGEDAAGDDAAEVGIGLEQRAKQSEGAFLDLGLGHVAQHEIEQRRHALIHRALGRVGHPAGAAGTVEDGEIKLLVGGVEGGEQVEHLVHDLGDARVRTVDLVDADDGLEADFQGLADDELGLRHGALGRVDEHDGAVDHGQDALDLAAEIGVAGGVDDVDAHVLPVDGRGLGHDRDAALFFQIVGVHHALGDALIVAEGAGLAQQLVDEGGLAVIDVSDDGDIAEFHKDLLGRPRPGSRGAGGMTPS